MPTTDRPTIEAGYRIRPFCYAGLFQVRNPVGTVYVIDADRRTCSCKGNVAHGRCKHVDHWRALVSEQIAAWAKRRVKIAASMTGATWVEDWARIKALEEKEWLLSVARSEVRTGAAAERRAA